MPAQQPTAVVEDLEQRRRAQLTDGKCLDLVGSRLPRALAMEVRQLAERAGTSVSDWVMQAVVEKIVNDETKAAAREMLAQAEQTRPQGISRGLHDDMVRRAIEQVTKPRGHK